MLRQQLLGALEQWLNEEMIIRVGAIEHSTRIDVLAVACCKILITSAFIILTQSK